jgi:aspartate aminotransferase
MPPSPPSTSKTQGCRSSATNSPPSSHASTASTRPPTPSSSPTAPSIILNSPSNPLGTVLPAELLAEIAAFADRHNLVVISDEAYDQITFSHAATSIAALASPDRVVSCFTLSKTYAMTGWRVGYLVAPATLAPIVQKLQEPITSCVNAASQQAAIAALRGPQDGVAEMVAAYRRRRDTLMSVLDQSEAAYARPEGAFYAWVSIAGYPGSSREFSRHVLAERSVAVAPGSAFGPSGEGWVRLSLATDQEQLLEGASRLLDFLASARKDRRCPTETPTLHGL